jgi:SEC-C motif-containing protein
MKPEVRALIKQAGLCRSTVEQVVAMLPGDDLELDRWIAEAIRENDSIGAHAVIFAALNQGRPVDARHLSGLAKLSGGGYLAVIALRVQGEMPEFLVEGLRNTAIHHIAYATALLAIAVWCDERRRGDYPADLIPLARALARRVEDQIEVDAYLLEVAARTKDSVLHTLIREHYPAGSDANWKKVVAEARKIAQQAIDWARGPLLAVLPEEPLQPGNAGATVRRAVSRTGRNDPCPCGSGKKYKHCCYDKDRERLQQSSEVAGLTRAELAADPERHLTRAALEKKSTLDLIAMDAAAIPRHLLADYFFRLSLVDLDRAAANLEKLGYEEDLEDAWFITMFHAVRAGRKDIGDRMMALRRPFGLKEEDLRLSQRLLLARDEPSKWVRLVEEAARNGLKTENADGLMDLAFSVAMSDQSALGLILYRGVLPFVPPDKVKST